ncbi:MAG: cytochrome P450 [bacterium]|nr:cytochrome P450 [bacterium]
MVQSVARPSAPNTPYAMFGAEARKHAHAHYAAMRREMPVCPILGPMSGNMFWFVTRYDDCVYALKQPHIIKDHLRLPEIWSQRYGGKPEGIWAAINRHLLNLDPPDHTRLRALVHKAFTPALIENLRARTQGIADALIDKVIRHNAGRFDLIEDYGFPLPITVIAELIGVPANDQDEFRRWTKTLLFGRDEAAGQLAAFEFVNYVNGLIEARQAHPQPDLLTGLLSAEEAGDALDREELLSMIFLLLVAGHETTVNLIGNGMLALFEHPHQRARLQADFTLIKPAIEEMLRYNGPVETATIRFALEDVEIRGVTIPQGEMVLVALHAANRDPDVFPDPERFDITRDPNRHIAFGNGIHFCLGAPLARMEGAIAIETLLRRLPDLQAAPGAIEHVEWNDSILLHGMKALDVVFQTAR